ncbi:hypothetical protein, partial [Pantoea sp.]
MKPYENRSLSCPPCCLSAGAICAPLSSFTLL